MRKLLLLPLTVTVTLAMIAFAPAAAQARTGLNVGVKAGYMAPTGDFGRDFDGALAYGLAAEFSILPPIAVELAYLRHEHDDSDGLGVELVFDDLILNGKLHLGIGPLTPYLTGGLGVYSWEWKEGGVSREETDYGANAGIGLSLSILGTLNVTLDGRYHYVITGEDDNDTFEMFGVMGTVAYWF